MEPTKVEVLKLLYIGGDTNIINRFKEYPHLFDIHTTENGLAAITYLKNQHQVSAIIAEDNLPGMNGLGLYEMIKNKSFYNNLPFILISHEKNIQLKQQALKSRIDDLYFTPLNIENIYTRVQFLQYFKSNFTSEISDSSNVKEYHIPLIKRIFDIVVSLLALVLLMPLFAVVAAAIRVESKGKVFYSSKRVGTGYRIFNFYKFRSMYSGADSRLKEYENLNQYNKLKQTEQIPELCPRCSILPEGEFCSPTLYKGGEKICEHWYSELKKRKASSTFLKIENDPRVTRVGNFIRNTSIDELPQLINVLKGDMSIVGNRPLPLYEAELLTSDDWSERFLGPAGITGLWQVELRGKGGNMSEEQRKALDNQYARSYSFWGDIKIIFRTIPALLQKENV